MDIQPDMAIQEIKVGMNLRFVISHIDTSENLLKIWIQPDLLGIQKVVSTLQSFQSVLEKPRGYMHQCQLSIGTYCCVKPTDSDNWFRARIIRHAPNDGIFVIVYYIDYGHTGVIRVTNVRPFNETLFCIPPQAIKCVVAEVASSTGEAWHPEAISYMNETLLHHNVAGTVISKYRAIPYVNVLVDGCSFAHRLIENGMGIPLNVSVEQKTPTLYSGETYRALPLDVTQEHLVYVSHTDNPHKFYIQLACKEQELNNLMEELEKYAKEKGFFVLDEALCGTPCVAQFSEDNNYYRAIVTVTVASTCQVTFVDYGNSEIKSCYDLKVIPHQFLAIPAQAKECTLTPDIVTDTETFQALVEGKLLSCQIIGQKQTSHVVRLCNSNGTQMFGTEIKRPIVQKSLTFKNLDFSIGTTHNVFVSYVHSPAQFYCQLAQNSSLIDDLMAKIASMYEMMTSGDNPLYPNELLPGTPVCSQFSEDEQWYRGIILTPLQQSCVVVQFVDYGNEEKTSPQKIKRLNPNLFELPIQAIKCSLYNFDMFALPILESEAVIQETEKMIINIPLVIKLEDKRNDTYLVSLFDTSSNPPVCINNKLQEFICMLTLQTNNNLLQDKNALNMPYQQQSVPEEAEVNESGNLYPPLATGALEEVVITNVSGPESFHCQLQKDSFELDTLMEELTAYYNNLGVNDQAVDSANLGMLCVAKYSSDENWYRAKIIGILQSKMVEVLYVDYGNREQTNLRNVKKILPEFLLLPFKAIECSLADVDYATLGADRIADFQVDVLDNVFTAVIKGEELGIYKVELLDSEENNINEKYRIASTTTNQKWNASNSVNQVSNDFDSGWNTEPEKGLNKKSNAKLHNNNWEGTTSEVTSKSTNNACVWEESEVTSKSTNNTCVWEESDPADVATSSANYISSDGKRSSSSSWKVSNSERSSYQKEKRFSSSSTNDDDERGSSDRLRRRQRDNLNDQRSPRSESGSERQYGSKGGYKKEFNDGQNSRKPYQNEKYRSKDQGYKSDKFGSDRSSYKSDRFGDDQNFRSNKFGGGENYKSYKSNQFGGDNFDVKEVTDYKQIEVEDGAFRYITVTHVINPNEFYCHLDDGNKYELPGLMEQIGQCYGSLGYNESCFNNPQSGNPCCILFSKDNAWYRGKITNVSGNNADVFYVDYGNSENIPLTNVKVLKKEFLNLPMQALKCSCQGVQAEETVWKDSDIEAFKDMTENKCHLAQFVNKGSDNTYLVNLMAVDTLTDSMLNKKFLKTGHGRKKEFEGSPKLKLPYSYSVQINLTEQLLSDGQKEEVTVTWALSLERFYCQLSSFAVQFQDMMTAIQKEYSTMSEFEAVIDRPTPNTYCMANFTEDNGWYRAKIVYVKGNMVGVYYVDYGNNEEITRKRIKYVLPQFAELPKQAIKCELNGLKVSETTVSVNETLVEKYFTGNITCTFISKTEDCYLVSLETSGKDVAQRLIEDNLVTPNDGTHAAQSVKLIYPKLILSDRLDERLNVNVTYPESPYKFWCQLANESEKLDEIIENIESHYAALDENSENLMNPAVNTLCTAKYSEDGQWYRAVIKNVRSNEVEVLFIDYGNSDTVPLSQVKTITPELSSVPAQSVECGLKGIPSNLSEEKQNEFIDLVTDKEMIIQIHNYSTDGLLLVTMFDASDGGEVNVAEKLYGELIADSVSNTFRLPVIPEGTVEAYISIVNSISDFYVQLSSEEDSTLKLKADLDEVYNNLSPGELSLTSAVVNTPCCAKFSSDNSWYRASIVGINGDQVTVNFVDYGNEDTISLEDVKVLKEEYFTMPCFAIRCCLKGVIPTPDEIWSDSAVDWFTTFTQDKPLQLQFHSGTDPVSVTVITEEGDITDFLISENFAIREDEIVEKSKDIDIQKEPSKDSVKLSFKHITPVQLTSSLVSIAYIETACSFYVFPLSLIDELNSLHERLQKLCSEECEQLQNISLFEPCIVKFSQDNDWYRAEIVSISEEFVTVRFADYGNKEIVKKDNLKILNAELFDSPRFAEECQLSNLIVNSENLDEAKSLFQNLTNFKEFTVEIINDNIPYEVCLKTDDENLNEILVESGLFSQIDTKALKEPKPSYISIPAGKKTEVIVSHSVSPSEFWVQLAANKDEIETLLERLAEVYTSDETVYSVTDIRNNELCVAYYPSDENWYRAIINKIENESIEVCYIDYGNTETVSITEIRQILPEFQEIPVQAVKCRLEHLKPLNSDNEEWSDDACELFTELVGDKVLIADCQTKSDCYIIRLLDMGLDISDILIEKAMASKSTSALQETTDENEVSELPSFHRSQEEKIVPGQISYVDLSASESPGDLSAEHHKTFDISSSVVELDTESCTEASVVSCESVSKSFNHTKNVASASLIEDNSIAETLDSMYISAEEDTERITDVNSYITMDVTDETEIDEDIDDQQRRRRLRDELQSLCYEDEDDDVVTKVITYEQLPLKSNVSDGEDGNYVNEEFRQYICEQLEYDANTFTEQDGDVNELAEYTNIEKPLSVEQYTYDDIDQDKCIAELGRTEIVSEGQKLGDVPNIIPDDTSLYIYNEPTEIVEEETILEGTMDVDTSIFENESLYFNKEEDEKLTSKTGDGNDMCLEIPSQYSLIETTDRNELINSVFLSSSEVVCAEEGDIHKSEYSADSFDQSPLPITKVEPDTGICQNQINLDSFNISESQSKEMSKDFSLSSSDLIPDLSKSDHTNKNVDKSIFTMSEFTKTDAENSPDDVIKSSSSKFTNCSVQKSALEHSGRNLNSNSTSHMDKPNTKESPTTFHRLQEEKIVPGQISYMNLSTSEISVEFKTPNDLPKNIPESKICPSTSSNADENKVHKIQSPVSVEEKIVPGQLSYIVETVKTDEN